jgi:predicted murein hydrolase (TIGR00659 family)
MLTIVAFETGLYLNRKTRLVILHPMVVAMGFIIIFLQVFDINLASYKKGGDLISFFLGPATVILAVPLYKQWNVFKQNALPIFVGIVVGAVTAVGSIIYLGKIFKLNEYIILSLIPKSVTNPIGVELSRQLGGNPSITVAVIILTGILGAVLGPSICRMFRIRNRIAVGIALGTASHAVGTSKAIELGETEGAMSGLAIGLAGLSTVLVAPLLVQLLL